MAKRKHAAALFEVFHDTKLSSARAPRPASWWFKSKPSPARSVERSEEPAEYDANDPTTMAIRSPLIAPRIAAVEAMDPAPAASAPARRAAEPLARIEIPAKAPRRDSNTNATSSASDSPQPSIREQAAALLSSLAKRCHVDVDAGLREVRLQLPFNVAVVSLGVIFLLVVAAYVVGRHGSDRKIADLTSRLADVQVAAAEVHPSALDVPRHASHSSSTATPIRPPARPASQDLPPRESAPVANSVNNIEAAPQDPTHFDLPRTIGLNYVVIQTYPTEAAAEEARDFWTSHDIACTVEKVPPRVCYSANDNWRAVITTRGFDRDEYRSEYPGFAKQVGKIAEKFGKKCAFVSFRLQAN